MIDLKFEDYEYNFDSFEKKVFEKWLNEKNQELEDIEISASGEYISFEIKKLNVCVSYDYYGEFDGFKEGTTINDLKDGVLYALNVIYGKNDCRSIGELPYESPNYAEDEYYFFDLIKNTL